MSVRKVITTILCKFFHMNHVMALTSATDSVKVIDITEDEEEVMAACTDTEEGRLQSQTLIHSYRAVFSLFFAKPIYVICMI